MPVVQAQVVANSSADVPRLLFTAGADCVVNIFCVNPSTEPQASFVEVRLANSTQAPAQMLVPGSIVPSAERVVEGPVYLKATDTVYVYGGSTAQVWSLYGQSV